MADDPTPDPAPEPTPDPEPTPEPDPAPTDPAPDDGDEPLDTERAKAKIKKANSENENLRRRLKELEPLANKAKELEDANKTEMEKLTERLNGTESKLGEVEGKYLRLDVALDKAPEGMSVAQIRKLAKRLSGSSREELEADAEELFAEFAPEDAGGDPKRRPTERLRPGAAPASKDEANDPEKLAAQVSPSW
jgi:flagellar biosynthesis chaperone FliJ